MSQIVQGVMVRSDPNLRHESLGTTTFIIHVHIDPHLQKDSVEFRAIFAIELNKEAHHHLPKALSWSDQTHPTYDILELCSSLLDLSSTRENFTLMTLTAFRV